MHMFTGYLFSHFWHWFTACEKETIKNRLYINDDHDVDKVEDYLLLFVNKYFYLFLTDSGVFICSFVFVKYLHTYIYIYIYIHVYT